jgi:hypothetical protein
MAEPEKEKDTKIWQDRKSDILIILVLLVGLFIMVTRPGFYGGNIARGIAFSTLIISFFINWRILKNFKIIRKIQGYIFLFIIFLTLQSSITDIIVGAYGGLVFNSILLIIMLIIWRSTVYKHL